MQASTADLKREYWLEVLRLMNQYLIVKLNMYI